MSKENIILNRREPNSELIKLLNNSQLIIAKNTVNIAYEQVELFFKNKVPDFLIKNPRWRKLIPECKNIATEYFLMSACDKGLLPLSYSICENYGKTGDYVQFKFKKNDCVLTVNQVRSKKNSSRNALFRKEMREQFNSRLNLYSEDEPYCDNMLKYYVELCHGYQSIKPQFVTFGIPDNDNRWISYIDIQSPFLRTSKGEEKDIQTSIKDISDFNNKRFESFIFKNR